MMEATVEISMYPLHEEYEQFILKFIEDLKKQSGFEVRVNESSTHLFGDYDAIMDALKEGMRRSYQQYDKTVFVMKVLGSNLKGSADHL